MFNPTSGFVLSGGQPATFPFAGEDGTISGWNSTAGASAVIVVDNSASGAVYKGLALGGASSGPSLYIDEGHGRCSLTRRDRADASSALSEGL